MQSISPTNDFAELSEIKNNLSVGMNGYLKVFVFFFFFLSHLLEIPCRSDSSKYT